MKNKQQNLTVFLFLIYLGILLWVILLKMGFSLSALHQMRRINLDPFRGMSLKEAARNSEVILNVLIFIPFGLYLRMLKVNGFLTIIIGFLFSLLMETTQYILAIGYTDVTDLITNTSGTIIGVITYFFFLCYITIFQQI